MKKLLFILPVIISFVYGQPGHKRGLPFSFQQLKPTVQVLPVSDSEIRIFYLYRIPYKSIVFEKEAENYSAEVRILAELYLNDKFVTREYKDVQISVNDFSETTDNENCLQGFISFNLSPENYLIKGTVTDLGSAREMDLSPFEVHGIESFEKKIYQPIVIKTDTKCNGNNFPLIVNSAGDIPFSSQEFELAIPVSDTTIQSLSIKIGNEKNGFNTKTTQTAYTTPIGISDCEGNLFITENDDLKITKNFVFGNFSRSLNEGPLLLTIISDNNNEITFPLSVTWFDKPISLRNPEAAIELLSYIEDDTLITRLLNADEEEYPRLLSDYWEKYDPTPETKYNELMAEYYSRIDYAAINFKGITQKNGIKTDRGRIYIKYGKPDKVERYSNTNGNMIEKWIYNQQDMKFIFIDKLGTGNFVLVEG